MNIQRFLLPLCLFFLPMGTQAQHDIIKKLHTSPTGKFTIKAFINKDNPCKSKLHIVDPQTDMTLLKYQAAYFVRFSDDEQSVLIKTMGRYPQHLVIPLAHTQHTPK